VTNTPQIVRINLGSNSNVPGTTVTITANLVTAGLPGRRRRQRHHLRQHRRQPQHRQLRREPALSRTISGGVVSVVGNQTTMRILVLGAPLNTDPIPDGPALHLHLRHPRQRVARNTTRSPLELGSRRILSAATSAR
jgi:hypothetical protein